MSFAIRVDNLGKRYRLGLTHAGSIRELVNRTWKRLLGRREKLLPHEEVELRALVGGDRVEADGSFWALKDVSFEVQPGEVVGIIGRNGSGKSTLLKILSQITAPTTGRVELHGRVASLLEVGTGFHPELSGRENVFLNGAILGMTKAEIRRKFDEIVAFAEIEKFVDTPVKRYSSGMYVRLAFAVAAHLEPEILVVDEVLAVGDLAFQQKCLNHMRTLTNHGMTILLVSHNMAAIQSCCERSICLDRGKLTAEGPPIEVIESYRQAMQKGNNGAESVTAGAEGVSIIGFEMFGEDGNPTRQVRFGEAVRIRIDVHAERRVDRPMINFGIKRGDGLIICNFNNWYDQFEIDFIEGFCSLEGWLPPLRIVPDFFEIHALVWLWGGGHLPGDMMRSRPLATANFGYFQVIGPALHTEEDGVLQMPAKRWRFNRSDKSSVVFDVDTDNLLSHVG